jgi:hypothetical protein
MSNLIQKTQISLSSAVLLLLVNMPKTFAITNSLSGNVLIDQVTGCPNFTGIIIHTFVFFALTFLSMDGANVNTLTKLKHTIYGTLIYFFITNPVVYKLIARIFGDWVADTNGCPTFMGLLLHSLVYMLSLIGVMFLP